MSNIVDKIHPTPLNVGQADHHGDWNWKNVRSPFARLYLVTDGTAKVVLPGGTHTLTAGHLYYIPAFTMHSNVCSGHFVHYYIHIFEEQQGLDTAMLEEWDMPVEVTAHEEDILLMQRLCSLTPFLRLPQSDPDTYDNQHTLAGNLRRYEQSPLHVKVEARGILLTLLARFISEATHRGCTGDRRIVTAIDNIRRHADRPPTIESLANTACMSKDHFIRMFRNATGQTPGAYMTLRKIERAEQLLVTTDLPVKAISAQLGYYDCSYFNRTFKQHTGLTPQQYRQRQQ